jgi:hypothetical protein
MIFSNYGKPEYGHEKYLKIFIILILVNIQISADPGLRNVGNSCFFNATMQALSHVKCFRDKINQIKEEDVFSVRSEYEARFAREFVKLVKNISKQKGGTLKPSDTYDAMIAVAKDRSKGTQKYLVGRSGSSGASGEQHDPSEVLDLLLFKSFAESGCSALTGALSVFDIKLVSEAIRDECGHITSSEDTGPGRNWIEFDLTRSSFDPETFEQKIEKLKSADLINFCKNLFINGEQRELRCDWCTAKQWINEGKLTREDLGENLFDTLKSDGPYDINLNSQIADNVKYGELLKTGKKFVERQARRIKKFNNIPKAMIFNFKRFLQTQAGARGEKLDTAISFPLELDLFPYLSSGLKSNFKEVKYKLRSIICHAGSLDGGHHYAYCWSDEDNCWYSLSDSSVDKVDNIESHINNSSAAFIIFYEQDKVQEFDEFQTKLRELKITLENLKSKLQRLQERLGGLRSKLLKRD